MGLEEFLDQDDTKNSSTTSETTDKDDNHTDDGDTESSTGPYGYPSFDEYEQTIDGHVERVGDLFKYQLPVFPELRMDATCEHGLRYTLGDEEAIVSCITSGVRPLNSIPRDVIMLDTGEVEKEACMDVLSNRFSTEVTDSTQVRLYMFAYVRHISKMAMGDSMTDDWSLEKKDHVLKAIYNESYTQRFRKANGVDDKLKGTFEIPQW